MHRGRFVAPDAAAGLIVPPVPSLARSLTLSFSLLQQPLPSSFYLHVVLAHRSYTTSRRWVQSSSWFIYCISSNSRLDTKREREREKRYTMRCEEQADVKFSKKSHKKYTYKDGTRNKSTSWIYWFSELSWAKKFTFRANVLLVSTRETRMLHTPRCLRVALRTY